jgi:hypothetical protein
MKVNYILIFFILILFQIYLLNSQKCNIYNNDLQKINDETLICEKLNGNNNTYCDIKISNCICNINSYGENCEKNITGVKIVEIGITNSSFNLIVLLFLILSPVILIIGFFIIAFIYKDQEMRLPSFSFKSKGIGNAKTKIKSNKVSMSKSKGNSEEFKSNKIENDKYNYNDNDNYNYKQYSEVAKSNINNDNTYNNNSNNLFNKKEKEIFDRNMHKINEITDNDNYNDDDINKYSQIPLSTITDRDRYKKDDNILITLRNNTDNDLEDLSKSKVIGIEELNKSKEKNKYKNKDKNLFFDDKYNENNNNNNDYYEEEDEAKEIFYAEKLLEIEEFTSEFKSSLQEIFCENENFMIFIDKIFTGIENDFSRKINMKNYIFYKSKSELQKIFNKIINDIPNGKNYMKSNNFFIKYQKIFDIKSKDDNKRNINFEEEENLQFRNSEGEISFSKENIIDPKKIILNVKDKSENLDISGREENPDFNESHNNINKIKNRVMKKAFMIKSVEISRNNSGSGVVTGIGRKGRVNSKEKEINYKNIDKDIDINRNKNQNLNQSENENVDIRKNMRRKRKGSNDSN